MNWRHGCARLDRRGVEEMTSRREELLERCLARGARLYEGNFAKIYTHGLSPGCLSCARGEWSYLEVSQLCQKSCFYCPRPYTKPGRPFERMLGLSFDSPEAYAQAVREFGFRGVGLSGGEPLLAMDRTLGFLRALRRSGGDGVYLWAYTNGERADETRLRQLRDAGLNELRFDISASDYDLTAVRRAIRILPKVAVEIPAIPEDLEKLKSLLGRLVNEGVSHLNLHQLTGTPFNCEAFRRRGYTVVENGPMVSPSVVESEMAALSLIDFALAEGIRLPINYCSFIYKHRFHGRIRRSRLAGYFNSGGPLETVTEPGWLRKLLVAGKPATLAALARRIPGGRSRFVDHKGKPRLIIAPEILGSAVLRGRAVAAAYFEYEQVPSGFGGRKGLRLGLPIEAEVRYRETCKAEMPLRGQSERACFARWFGPSPSASASGWTQARRTDFRARFKGYEFLTADRHSYLGGATSQ